MSMQRGGPHLLASQCLSISSNYYNKFNNCACRRNMSMFETISLVLIYAIDWTIHYKDFVLAS